MRKQYHARRVGANTHIWDIHRLIPLSKELPVTSVALSDIAELDENWWFSETTPTPRAIAEHIQLMNAADLSHPILVCAEGRLMDGMHRVLRALLEGQANIRAVTFHETPPPDFINISLDDLPYPDEGV